MKHFFKLSFLSIVIVMTGCAEKPIPLSEQPKAAPILVNTIAIAADTNQYLYDFIKMVVKDQKLNYSYGLTLEVENELSHESDDSYLLKFIKAAPQTITYYPMGINRKDTLLPDSSIVQIKADPFVFATEAFSIINPIACLTKRDINYMLAEKRRLQNFKWNNERLGFNLHNKNNWYRFSLPYFSKDKKTALICIRSLCKPFLCGDGYILLYKFENKKWTSAKVDYWIH